MDVLILEPLDVEVMDWLAQRYSVRLAPELVRDPREFLKSLDGVRALILPPSVAFDSRALFYAKSLRVIGRASGGCENIDLDACARLGIDVVRSPNATAHAEAEFMVGALLSMLRRLPVVSSDGMLVGRELGSCTVGLVGMLASAKAMTRMLRGFGSRVVGYDPAVHARDGVWDRWNTAPMGLRQLLEVSDAVCVQLNYFSRFQGLLGERLLPHCKRNQVIVSLTHSGVFDEKVLAEVLRSGRVAAIWFDSLEPGTLAAGRPLNGVNTLQVSPCLAGTTRESRLRSAWTVARGIDVLLTQSSADFSGFKPTQPGEPIDLASDLASQ